MEYVDTQLIECSRISSEQVKGDDLKEGDNKALFTNKLSQAVVLEVGDKVSVERSFINGLGSGNAETIQFKGKHIPQHNNKVLTYTDVTLLDKEDDPEHAQNYRLGYFNTYFYDNITEEIEDLRDNEVNFTIGYFINNNNHNQYIQLPRRFACKVDAQGVAPAGAMHEVYSKEDGYSMGFPANTIQPDCFCRSDWVMRRGNNEDHGGEYDIYKCRVDNKRFALFVRDKAYYTSDNADAFGYLPDTNEFRMFPLWKTYIRYLEKKKISVKKGFNTPSSVASQITQQLNATKPPDRFFIDIGGPQIQLTETIEGELYKPFNSSSFSEFSTSAYDKYVDITQNDNNVLYYFNSFLFMGVKRPEIFETGRLIPQRLEDGITLPEPQGFKLLEDIPLADHTDATINHGIDYEYTKENLLLIRDMFDAQKLYPELWDRIEDTPAYNVFTGEPRPTNTRFFHINKWGGDGAFADPNPVKTTQEYLGDDGMEKIAGGNLTNKFPKSSMPWFIHYDDTYHDEYYAPDLIPPDVFVFGFAKSVFKNGKYYLAVRIPQVIDVGIPTKYFTELDGGNKVIKAGRRLGYDWNATAFGSCFIIPYSGYSPESYEGNVVLPHPNEGTKVGGGLPTFRRDITKHDKSQESIMDLITQTYIGANNPLLDYDESTNRFILANLHTAENVGDVYNAGDPVGRIATNHIPVPIDPDASKIVYKINPRVTPWGYSPTFLPYADTTGVAYTFPDGNGAPSQGAFLTNTRNIKNANENIESYAIFDAHCGVYINDAGINELEWNDSLWGILGFDYNQYNSPVNENNTLLKRIDINNKFNLRYPTTNAEVDVSDTKSYIANEYGAVLYTTQIPMPLTMQSYSGANALDFTTTLFPFISQLTQSISLSAKNLSKQMLNPFYTIRSDIISNTKYLGGLDSGIKMPVIGVVDRYGAEGDYYFGTPSDVSFTITKQTSIGDITTSIHDPDGSLALLDNNSGIIYKIQRNRVLPSNVIEEIEKNDKKK
tara:strand:- start:1655 stop:4651 length:2997 start_codon:yes stop_codon:yes gene_type:complete